ncbi:GntP family permease [Corynebacterium epidermidicanis]|uniref:Gluconate transporter n=1 Tax=Corynebacterium epidermidicanis TaxID=1050174 RepID=A0A0G3GUE8_9CORY|nr:gluconate:H+ symporter [Corynebacterium epidermidicanis]AKK04130.1 gluconate transporter [Corynebacterium epidermidicanis]
MLHSILAADATPLTTAPSGQLVFAACLGIFAIIGLISWAKIHPFLSLMLGSAVMALTAGVPLGKTFTAFSSGMGSTVAGVGVLIALGAAIGALLVESGGADEIVDTFLDRTTVGKLPWVMAALAFIIGIPLFFEVGLVLLIPVVMLVARRSKIPVILLGIPALAGLSALHGLVPPHPGPLIAIDALHANLGLTLGLGLLVAVPTVAISGPFAAKIMAKWVPIEAPASFDSEEKPDRSQRPSFATAISVIMLPVVLMLARTVTETIGLDKKNGVRVFFDFAGSPLVALLITVLFGMVVLGLRVGKSLKEISSIVGGSFGPIAGILLIVGAGGGFKQTLVDTGVAKVIGAWIQGAPLSPLFAGWLVAVAIRLATGSATVSTITTAGIMAPVAAAGMTDTHIALLVLAIGAGSVFLSHVNDAGFWLVKEYFGMTIGQTFKTWSLMETILSVVGLICVLLLGLVI